MTTQNHFDIGGAGFEYGDSAFVNGNFATEPLEDDLLFLLVASVGPDDATIGTPPTISSPTLVWTLEENITLGDGSLMLTIWTAVIPADFALPEEVTLFHGDGSVTDYFNTLLIRNTDPMAGPVVQSNTAVVASAATASITLTNPFASENNIALVITTEEFRDASGVTSPNFLDTNIAHNVSAPPPDDYYGPAGYYSVGDIRLPANFNASPSNTPTRWLLAAFEIAMLS